MFHHYADYHGVSCLTVHLIFCCLVTYFLFYTTYAHSSFNLIVICYFVYSQRAPAMAIANGLKTLLLAATATGASAHAGTTRLFRLICPPKAPPSPSLRNRFTFLLDFGQISIEDVESRADILLLRQLSEILPSLPPTISHAM